MNRFFVFFIFFLFYHKTNAQNWELLTPAITPRTECQCIEYNNKLYVFSGFKTESLEITSTTEVYDPESNKWEEIAPIPIAVSHMGAALSQGKVYIAGGFEGDHPGKAIANLQIYNIAANSWSQGPSIPEARGSNTTVINGRKLHVFGGLLADRNTDSPDHFVLDLDNIQAGWQKLAPLPFARNHMGAASLNGKIYAVGGQYGHDISKEDQALLHVYDPEKNQWERLADLPETRSHFEPSIIVYQNKLIIVGGRTDSGPLTNKVTAYDPAKNIWIELPKMPEKLLAPCAKIIKNKLIVSHGMNSHGPQKTARSTNMPDSIEITSIEEPPQLFMTSFPNPFFDKITFEVLHHKQELITLEILDISGRAITKLYEGNSIPGQVLTFYFNGSGYSNGVYITRLKSRDTTLEQKIILLK